MQNSIDPAIFCSLVCLGGYGIIGGEVTHGK